MIYVIPTLQVGGAETQTINQVNHLHKIGVDVSLIVLTDKIPLKVNLIIPEEKIITLKMNRLSVIGKSMVFDILTALTKFRRNLIDIKPTHVIANLPISHLLCRLVKKISPVKFELWLYHHSMQFEATPLDTYMRIYFHKFNQLLCRKFDDGHLFISRAVKENISKNLPIHNGHTIHNAIPEKIVDAELALDYLRKNNLDQTMYRIVIPGRLHPVKGHLFFLGVLKTFLFQKESVDLQIFFIGGGPLEEEITQYIGENTLENSVYLTGTVNNDLLLSFLKIADLVCIPSIHEGFGNVAVEALMQGSTILASNTGGLPEIIEDGKNGFLFEKENSVDLLQKLTFIIGNRLKLDSKKLINDYKDRFTLESQIQTIIRTINETPSIQFP